ncbi:family 78 glycoside hydrolase catalytic domain [Paenarthrobacter sp. NPDC089989]|uniref:family 78 glycoside hydrolase catalytic domain n=1 Tax=unclassified Paenarthrobacter TaxID=2634190 RepID=UPI00380596EB
MNQIQTAYSSPSRAAAARRLQGAAWISFPEEVVPPAGKRPAYVFRKNFTLVDVPSSAEIHATAHGLYELFINGVRVGDEELSPGFTSYHSTLHVQSFLVTDLLTRGDNEVRVVLSDGWFRGRHGYNRVPDSYGERTAVVARLDAGSTVLLTDGSWETAASEIVAADLMDGQTVDFRRIGAEQWKSAVVSYDPLTANTARLAISPAPPVRCTERVAPKSISRLSSGRQIVDFGVMLNGWVRLTDLGPAGTSTTLTHGESLDVHGDLTMGHLAALTFPDRDPLPTGQIDRAISRGVSGDVFEPRHTTHGFRYVALDGRQDDVDPGAIEGVMVRSDLRQTASFACSNPDLNRLHEIAVQTWRTNSCDVPTDCPTRERYGYTGDFQIYAHTAAFLEDTAGFSAKWLRSLADDQFASGCIPNVAPNAGQLKDGAFSVDGASGWGDAATVVPWEMYLAYGDPGVLADSLPMMMRWVDYAADIAATQRDPEREALRPEPLPHERYLWDTGFHWGEWAEPGVDAAFGPSGDQAIVASAYLARSARIVAEAAALLSDDETAGRYSQIAEGAAAAWRLEFWHNGRLNIETQATYTRGLAFGLFSPEDVPAAVARLVELIHGADEHLATGFLSTPMLLPVLADHGHADLAYRVLLAEEEPGWMVMLRRGATAVWEAWDGIAEDGTPKDSLNHYSKGAVISFLHEYIAGLRLVEPGWRRFRVQPVPGGGLTWATVTHESPEGTINVAWQLNRDRFSVKVVVPSQATVEVILPNGRISEVGGGTHTLECTFK